MNTFPTKPRLNWIDWMKSLGMLAIVWGHFMPDSLISFLYAFSVPVFFLISGFLFKPNNNIKEFVIKNTKTLIVPMGIFYVVQILINVCFLRQYEWGGGILTAIIGNGYMLGGLWFVYTLILLKCIFNFLHTKSVMLFIVVISFVTINIITINLGFRTQNSWYNVLVASPFFLLGYLARNSEPTVTKILTHISRIPFLYKIVITILLATITYIISHYNGPAWMYLGQYGNNYILFLLGGASGCGLMIMLSKILDHVHSKWNLIISQGTIIILGLHYNAIIFSSIVYPRIGLNQHNSFISFISSLVVMILFIPVIKFISRYFPIAIGRTLKSTITQDERKIII